MLALQRLSPINDTFRFSYVKLQRPATRGLRSPPYDKSTSARWHSLCILYLIRRDSSPYAANRDDSTFRCLAPGVIGSRSLRSIKRVQRNRTLIAGPPALVADKRHLPLFLYPSFFSHWSTHCLAWCQFSTLITFFGAERRL